MLQDQSLNSASKSLTTTPVIPTKLLEFDNIFIHSEAWDSEVSNRFRTLYPESKVHLVTQEPFAKDFSYGPLTRSEFDRSKKNIFIKNFEGDFFKKCPGANAKMACCNYFVLNLGLQCNMNCSYCYLQSFINTPVMTVYANINKALNELKAMTEDFKGLSFRIGTGEVIDSLSLDPLTLYSRKLIEFFAEHKSLLLEFKTKSDYVDQFLDVDHAKNVIVSWSINPEYIIQTEEFETATLQQRLLAAKKCLDKNFKLSFHIDPVIWHPKWKENYSSLVKQITSQFSPQDIPYLSLGALRFQPEQRFIMKERFSMQSHVVAAEMHEGRDGKLRYDQDLRNEMFNYIIEQFKTHNPKWNIFLCMESPETWLSTFQATPRKVKGLESLFEPRAIK